MNTTAPSHDHIVKSFDTELARLTGEIIAMGELAAIQLDNAIDALGKRDSCVAQRIVDNDDALDDQERRISQDVLRLLALRQPMARDLREVLAALRVASNIERIGDHATNIAENIWFVVRGAWRGDAEDAGKHRHDGQDTRSRPECKRYGLNAVHRGHRPAFSTSWAAESATNPCGRKNSTPRVHPIARGTRSCDVRP